VPWHAQDQVVGARQLRVVIQRDRGSRLGHDQAGVDIAARELQLGVRMIGAVMLGDIVIHASRLAAH
jgi:hypothetical protein